MENQLRDNTVRLLERRLEFVNNRSKEVSEKIGMMHEAVNKLAEESMVLMHERSVLNNTLNYWKDQV